ncbi:MULTISPECIES: GntR family transcriptional regulator [unclassified Enterococcus]|uniref:GntR family transcriptional regulator n=1 Tax=unclassified Enterococcus TaxID=2608891 RepID=UPI0015568F81|nr:MULTISPECIES: GntR family transcriptional regulator [unclassified Enterococcus]MBS7578085.1 GntR family transcriptional regulator [Enterococcus sp. MMGLQ5-2]MBS7585345.1 GntR family transcriptional regulator [Enterococcus sp. MMGLQ5-1]NPD13202.1 GntR family transcriptional regulator [Enterococcus sp. MMGLQ5-1]NPD37916.1 GntR family transcriptional regulator [Enterococcus sp. MMGLQ5-2]
MNFDETSHLPLFQQVAEQIEEAILSGAFKEGQQIPSTTEISKQFQINPATVLKGMNILVEKQVIEKKRGIGMFVKQGARQILQAEKREYFFNQEISQLIFEAKRLNISLEELVKQIERGYQL